MKLSEVAHLLGAQVICGEELLGKQVESACGSDLMSDVLSYSRDNTVLLTGLINPQVVRTAEMMDISCVVFLRGKMPTPAIVDLARQSGIVLLRSDCCMFCACGLLYQAGIRGSDNPSAPS